jgi:hypothetical protein
MLNETSYEILPNPEKEDKTEMGCAALSLKNRSEIDSYKDLLFHLGITGMIERV